MKTKIIATLSNIRTLTDLSQVLDEYGVAKGEIQRTIDCYWEGTAAIPRGWELLGSDSMQFDCRAMSQHDGSYLIYVVILTDPDMHGYVPIMELRARGASKLDPRRQLVCATRLFYMLKGMLPGVGTCMLGEVGACVCIPYSKEAYAQTS